MFECLLKLRDAWRYEVVLGVTEEPCEVPPPAPSTAVEELSLLVSMSSEAVGASMGFKAPVAGFEDEDICIICRYYCSLRIRWRTICLWLALAIRCGSIEFFRILILMSLLEPT